MLGLTRAFENLFTQTLDRQGWVIPKQLTKSMVNILVERYNQPNWMPQPSYAEQYMQAREPGSLKHLGDTCWFTRAIFPELGGKRGINASYYTSLGQGCYSRVLQHTGPDLTIEMMIQHFDFLAEVAWTVIHSQGNFREMWSDD